MDEATLIERPAPPAPAARCRPRPIGRWWASLALKVAIIDGLGIEQSFATSRVEIKRSISQRASVEAKDDFARTMINDLIAASSRELETSIDRNLADRKSS